MSPEPDVVEVPTVRDGLSARKALRLMRWLPLIFLGGACGTMLRAVLEERFPPADGAAPWTTLAINVAGSFILGLVLELVSAWPDRGWCRAVRLMVGTGLLGGFTTYSTFMFETTERLQEGEVALAGSYLLGTVLAGLGAAFAGIATGAWMNRVRAAHRGEGAAT